MEQNNSSRRETLANTWVWVRRFGLIAAEVGRQAAQAVTRWRRSAAESVVSSVQGEKRQKAVSVTCLGHLCAKYHSDLEPVPSTGWGGQSGASTHRSTDRWRGRENNGMAASQTELPYCSDKGTGRRGGGSGGRHTCSCRWSNSSYCNKQHTEKASHPVIRGHLRTQWEREWDHSTGEDDRWRKTESWQNHTHWHMLHTHVTDVFIHALKHEEKTPKLHLKCWGLLPVYVIINHSWLLCDLQYKFFTECILMYWELFIHYSVMRSIYLNNIYCRQK